MLYARAAQPRQGSAAASAHDRRGAVDRRAAPARWPADRPRQANGRARWRAGQAHVLRIRDPAVPCAPARPCLQPRRAARARARRLRVPRPAHDRRAHPPPAREARSRSCESAADPDRAPSGVPLPGEVRGPLRLRSLKNKLALVFCGITLIAMAGVWFYVVPQLESNLRQQRQDELKRVALATIDPLKRAAGGRKYSPKHLDELVRAISDTADARVTLFFVQRSRTGAKLGSTISDSATSTEINETVDLADAAASLNRTSVGYGAVNDQSVAQVGLPIGTRKHAEWVALYSRSLDGVTETVDLIRKRLLAAGLLAGLLAIIGAYLVAGFVGRRVRRLERASRRVAAGQFVAPLPVTSRDELGQLTTSFNDMQQRLSRVDRARKEFVANASHELRTPLFSLGGFIELLEDEDLDPASRAELLSAMHGQVDRLQKLAVDLLDLSRLDAGSFELEQDRVDLADLAYMVVGEFAPATRRGDADIELRMSDGGVEVTCDRERVAQIMRILVDNAIRHTPNGTHVTISASRRNGSAKVTVADSGPGLESGLATQVFDRFFTGDSQNGGAGLGLAIAKELAQRMHGEIRLNARPGRTSFTLELPAGADEE